MDANVRQCRKHNFTKTFIDGLPPNPRNAKSREQEYSDQLQESLMFRND